MQAVKEHNNLLFFGNIKRMAHTAACRSPFYNWLLSSGDAPRHLQVKLADPWPGHADAGRLMCRGVLSHQGLSLPLSPSMWVDTIEHPVWQNVLHGFTWLRDLRAVSGDTSRRVARVMVEDWIASFDRWDSVTWRPDIMGQRITMWLTFYDFFCASADESFQRKYLASLGRQARHLSRVFPADLQGVSLMRAAQGLIYAGLSFAGREEWVLQGFDVVLREIESQIMREGTHVSGSPEALLQFAQILLDLRYTLNRAGLPVPEKINQALEKIGPTLRFFVYPDRKLALFHGGQECAPQVVESVLSQIRGSKRPHKGGAVAGFERVMQGRSLLMMDTSPLPESPYMERSHSAPLAFEFSYGRDRVFVNCGGHPYSADWQRGLQHTAAHNALMLDGHPVHEFSNDGRMTSRHGPICCVRRENKEACLIEAVHDAYRARWGIEHERRLFLSEQGHDLRGEDTLTSSVPLTFERQVVLRFHLHPKVMVSDIGEGQDVTLTLPGGSVWRFYGIGAALSLESSIYLGAGLKPAKTRQIVLSSLLREERLQVKWALQRE
ncbi:MAG: heparinase II/III family protein [Pseudobdellovibrionaceae bacterium]